MSFTLLAVLAVFGAGYGRADVTERVRAAVRGETLRLRVDSATFGDSWPGTQKTLAVVYSYDDGPPQVRAAAEGTMLEIHPRLPRQPWTAPPAGLPAVIGAAWGTANVTERVQSLAGPGGLHFAARTEFLGDPWPGNAKSLVVVVQLPDGSQLLRIVTEGERLDLSAAPPPPPPPAAAPPPPVKPRPLAVLGAAWGRDDVTDRVREAVRANELRVLADSSVFGDTWQGVQKTLVVVYQVGGEPPRTRIVPEGQLMEVNIAPPLAGVLRPTPSAVVIGNTMPLPPPPPPAPTPVAVIAPPPPPPPPPEPEPPAASGIWVRARDGWVPPDAFAAGRQAGRPVYLCRARHAGGMHPGKITAGGCTFGWSGEGILSHEYEVLTDVRAERWVAGFAGSMPVDAFVGGHERGRRYPVCRGKHRDSVQPGKLVDRACSIGHRGREILMDEYEVLVVGR